MFDDDDDDLRPRQKGVPALPRELQEKLFDLSNPEGAVLRYPGPELWPQRSMMGATQGFTRWRNPAARKVRMVFNLGPDPQLHVGFEMRLVPAQFRVSRDFAGQRSRAGLAIRREYLRMVVEIPPGGSVELPAEFDGGVRQVRNGIVHGGECPWLVKEGEEPPLPIHPALLPAEDTAPAFASAPAAARRLP